MRGNLEDFMTFGKWIPDRIQKKYEMAQITNALFYVLNCLKL